MVTAPLPLVFTGRATRVQGMSDLPRLLAEPFIGSWMASAKPSGPLHTSVMHERSERWAQWFLESIATMSSAKGRSYPAVLLPGDFYRKPGSPPAPQPHLEMSRATLRTSDRWFPGRLALIGNGLHFPQVVFQEVTAMRRALFTGVGQDLSRPLVELSASSAAVAAHAAAARTLLADSWDIVQTALIGDDPRILQCFTTPFSTKELANVFPPAITLNLEAHLEPVLAEQAGKNVTRRLGIWTLTGHPSRSPQFSLGVITPRLTRNSLLRDDRFDPAGESPAANIVTAALLYRVADALLNASPGNVEVTVPAGMRPPVQFTQMPAKAGARLPEASPAAAARFVAAFPTSRAAWDALTGWATSQGAALALDEESFAAAFARAHQAVTRAEDPRRSDIDLLLPIGWSQNARVIRVTIRHK